MEKTVKVVNNYKINVFENYDGCIDVDIRGKNINYSLSDIGKNVNTGEMMQMEGLQLNDYSKNDEIKVLCREIADKCKELMKKLPKNE